jgi:hypothetical protein
MSVSTNKLISCFDEPDPAQQMTEMPASTYPAAALGLFSDDADTSIIPPAHCPGSTIAILLNDTTFLLPSTVDITE